jgi:hypothetical protein
MLFAFFLHLQITPSDLLGEGRHLFADGLQKRTRQSKTSATWETSPLPQP